MGGVRIEWVESGYNGWSQDRVVESEWSWRSQDIMDGFRV